jgi:hypothetical protein
MKDHCMTIVRGVVYGILGGVTYAFISFYLLTPIILRKEWSPPLTRDSELPLSDSDAYPLPRQQNNLVVCFIDTMAFKVIPEIPPRRPAPGVLIRLGVDIVALDGGASPAYRQAGFTKGRSYCDKSPLF